MTLEAKKLTMPPLPPPAARDDEHERAIQDLIKLGWLDEQDSCRASSSKEHLSVILHSPPLTATRPYPSVIAHYRPLKTADVAASPEARELLLPDVVLAAGPYGYAPATDIVACPDDDRYFCAFFPKLDPTTTQRLQLQAASSVLQDVGTSSSSLHPFAITLSEDDLDYGGVIALYRNLDVIQQTGPNGTGQATYVASFPLEFSLQTSWTTLSSPVVWRWLHQSRRWAFSDEEGEKDKLVRLPARGPAAPFTTKPLFGGSRRPPHSPTFLVILSDGSLRVHYPMGVTLQSATTWTEAIPVGMLEVETSKQSSAFLTTADGQSQPPNILAQGLRIRRDQADIYLRPEDSRVFVAYRSSASSAGSPPPPHSTGQDLGTRAVANAVSMPTDSDTVGLGISTDAPVVEDVEMRTGQEALAPPSINGEVEDCIRIFEVDYSWAVDAPALTIRPMRKLHATSPGHLLALAFRDTSSGANQELNDDQLDLVCVTQDDSGAIAAQTCIITLRDHELLDAFSAVQSSSSAQVAESPPVRSDWTFERKDSMSVHVADDAHLDADRSQLIRSQGLLVDTETLKATRTQSTGYTSPNLCLTASVDQESGKILLRSTLYTSNGLSTTQLVARKLVLALHNQNEYDDICAIVQKHRLNVDVILQEVLRLLKLQSHCPPNNLSTSEWAPAILKLQARLFARRHQSRLLLELMAAEQVFSSSRRPGSFKIPQYDPDSMWLLNAWTQWWLAFVQALLKASAGFGTGHTFLLQSLWTRTLLRHVTHQVQSYVAFCWTLQQPIAPHPASLRLEDRDAASASLAATILGDNLERSGLKLDAIQAALKQVHDLLATTSADTSEDFFADVGDRVAPALAKLNNDSSLIKSRALLFDDRPAAFDAISQEPLDASPTWLKRQCASCGRQSVVYPMRIESAEVFGPSGQDSQVATITHGASGISDVAPVGKILRSGYVLGSSWWRWQQRWNRTCTCGGCWKRVAE